MTCLSLSTPVCPTPASWYPLEVVRPKCGLAQNEVDPCCNNLQGKIEISHPTMDKLKPSSKQSKEISSAFDQSSFHFLCFTHLCLTIHFPFWIHVCMLYAGSPLRVRLIRIVLISYCEWRPVRTTTGWSTHEKARQNGETSSRAPRIGDPTFKEKTWVQPPTDREYFTNLRPNRPCKKGKNTSGPAGFSPVIRHYSWVKTPTCWMDRVFCYRSTDSFATVSNLGEVYYIQPGGKATVIQGSLDCQPKLCIMDKSLEFAVHFSQYESLNMGPSLMDPSNRSKSLYTVYVMSYQVGGFNLSEKHESNWIVSLNGENKKIFEDSSPKNIHHQPGWHAIDARESRPFPT